MVKKTITYTGYDDVERTEDFYFNFTKSELIEMELGTTGGMTQFINKVTSTIDTPSLIKLFKELILKAYGEKSEDGRRFIKSKELSEAFSQNPAYDQLFMMFSTDADAAAKFIDSLIPQDLANEVQKSKPVTLAPRSEN